MRRFYAILVSLLFGLGLPVVAQESVPSAETVPGEEKPLDWLDDLGGDSLGGLDGGVAGGDMVLTGELMVQRNSRDGMLKIKAVIPPKWHTYAVDQQGGPGPSKITVKSADEIEVLAPFRPDRQPKVREVEEFEVPLREHYGEVVWTAPARLAEGVDPETSRIEAQFDGLICDDATGCKPVFGRAIKVTFAGYYEPTMPAGEYRPERSHVTIRGYVHPTIVQPGSTVKLVLTAVCDTGYHVYAYAPAEPKQGTNKPTLLVLKQPTSWSAGTPQASSEPIVKESMPNEPPVRYHEGLITWSTEINVAEEATGGEYDLTGIIGYQICTDVSCLRPAAAEFAVKVTVGDGVTDEQRPLTFADSTYGEAARLALARATPDAIGAVAPATAHPPSAAPRLELDNLDLSRSEQAEGSLVLILGIAFVGGFILNFMPCVLPVIGLKVMSFVQQAGENRAKVFALNLWYSFGLVSVFVVLATLVVVWHFGWGEIFTKSAFRITMAAVVFTMGLSFLGVWEIPIPGFVGSGKAAELADKEGPAGAFAKGILTTILSTPCSGPAVATAMVYCMNKPAPVVYTVFLAMGLGMASPYLVIGANPKLARFIPKPGAWMETFKQTMGFILLATVVFILTFIRWTNVMPTLALLFGLWAACWWVARTPVTARFSVKLRTWLAAMTFAVLIGLVAFGDRLRIGQFTLYGLQGSMESRFAADVEKEVDTRIASRGVSVDPPAALPNEDKASELPWEPFSQQKLERLIADNKTVLVDFTANWCLTCKMLEVSVLNTSDIRRIVDKNGIVTLVADWSDGSPEISKLLEALGGKQVPVVAIFPAGNPNQPLVMRGFYTKQDLIDKLQEAGPSKKTAETGSDVVEIAAGGS